MRIAILYDCLYPYTVGGAEHWYRRLAEHLSQKHNVTFVTRRQWERGDEPDVDFPVIVVSGGRELYTHRGLRRRLPPIRYGLGVFWHMVRHGRGYDVVNCASFPYFSLIAAWLALKLARSKAKLVVDWFECWTKVYWTSYSGPLTGRVGFLIQRLCLKIAPSSIVFSQYVQRRLVREGYKGQVLRLSGLYAGPTELVAHEEATSPPYVVYAGRHTAEKRVTSLPAAICKARERVPDLKCKIFGDGPKRPSVIERITECGLEGVVECPGFVDREFVDDAMRGALCLVLPSEREGYGMVVLEATARGTPAVVARSPDSAAEELIEEGENGLIAESDSADDLAGAIVKVFDAGWELRDRTARWFSDNVHKLSIGLSMSLAERYFEELSREANDH